MEEKHGKLLRLWHEGRASGYRHIHMQVLCSESDNLNTTPQLTLQRWGASCGVAIMKETPLLRDSNRHSVD